MGRLNWTTFPVWGTICENWSGLAGLPSSSPEEPMKVPALGWLYQVSTATSAACPAQFRLPDHVAPSTGSWALVRMTGFTPEPFWGTDSAEEPRDPSASYELFTSSAGLAALAMSLHDTSLKFWFPPELVPSCARNA